MAKPARWCHAVLRSGDVARLTDWYLSVLDGDVIFEGNGLAFMTYDEEHHRLGFTPIPDAAAVDPAAPGLVHLAFGYHDLSDLADQYTRLRDKRIYPRLTVDHGLTCSLYYQDPDGNGVECLVDLLSPSDATALMYSETFARNPIGLLMDPEDLVARVAGGLTPDELVAEYRATPIDVPATFARIEEIKSLSDDEYIEQFEQRLAVRAT
jgi:glyoxalase/bleomycin resistance protein/dioxygenase superfamily protein